METTNPAAALPGLDCGVCGFRTCGDLAARLEVSPTLIKRCIYLSDNRIGSQPAGAPPGAPMVTIIGPERATAGATCGAACGRAEAIPAGTWLDSLGREFDFYLEHFPEDPGPREIIIPHNPMITREMDIKVGDTLIGRPLGMSCGCPITHCGVAADVDPRTGVLTWCVTGPLGPRAHGYKDLGYYIAEGYEGLITDSRSEIRIGCRYYFQPRMCMLQWRHSGLVNFLNRGPDGLQVRLEGLWIG